MKLSHHQSCPCGASISIRAADSSAVEPAVLRWEQRHSACTKPKPTEPDKEGAGCAVLGFSPQPDHDSARTCGVTA